TPTPISVSSRNVTTRSGSERPQRSSRQTTTTSTSRRRAAFNSPSRAVPVRRGPSEDRAAGRPPPRSGPNPSATSCPAGTRTAISLTGVVGGYRAGSTGCSGERDEAVADEVGAQPGNPGSRDTSEPLSREGTMVYLSRAFALTLAVMSAVASADPPRPLAVEDALAQLAFANRIPIDVSPDGEWVAYTIQDPRRRGAAGHEPFSPVSRTRRPLEAPA